MITGFIFFAIAIFFIIYLPGRFLLRITNYQEKEIGILAPISIALGIGCYLFFVYLLKFIGLDLLYIIGAFVLGCIEFAYSVEELLKNIKNAYLPYVGILVLGVTCMSYITWNSGQYTQNGDLIFYGLNAIDGVWHISLLENLSHNYPPTHPGLSDFTFRGYNFFYDLFLVNFVSYLKLSVYDVYYRYGTVFLTLFYGLSVLSYARFVKMNRLTTSLFLILMLFAQGFAVSIFSYFSLFYDPGIPQTFAHIIGPNVLFSIALLLPSIILIFGKTNRIHSLLAGIILGVLPMIKIYAAVLVFGSLGIISVYQLIRFRDVKYLISLVTASIIAAVVYIPLNLGAGSLIFAPYLLYEDFAHRFSDSNASSLWDRLVTLSRENNYIQLVWYKVVVLLGLFYIPSLGIRIFSLISIKNFLRKDFYTPLNGFWIIFISVGFLIPSLFIQNIAFFVVLQFLWIVYFVLLIPTAFAWGKILSIRNLFMKIVFLIVFLILILPDSILFLYKYSTNPIVIESDFITNTNYLKTYAQEKEGILVLNTVERGGELRSIHLSPLVSALSAHSVYYEDEVLEVADLQDVIKNRKREIFLIQNRLADCQNSVAINKFLVSQMQKTNTVYLFDIQSFSCLDTLKGLKRVSGSGSSAVYKRVN